MPEKNSGDFLKMAWGAMSEFGSKAGKAIQSAVEQAAPKKDAPEADTEAQPSEKQAQPNPTPDESGSDAEPEAEGVKEPEIPAEVALNGGRRARAGARQPGEVRPSRGIGAREAC